MRTRPARPEDVGAISELLAARQAVDGREALSEYKGVRRGSGASGEIVAATGDGVIVGYAQAALHVGVGEGTGVWQVELVPAAGVGEQDTAQELLRSMLDRLPQGAKRSVWVWREPEVRAAEALGLQMVRRLVQMGRPLPADSPVPADGVALRAFRPGIDEDAWLAANNEAFAGHSEQGGWTRDEMAVRMAQPWFDPAGLLMAWDESDGHLIGSCWTKVDRPGLGEIYVIGVVPAAQGRGLGRFLVLAGLDHLASDRDCHTASLYTDPADAAIHLYEKLGFHVTFEKRVYR